MKKAIVTTFGDRVFVTTKNAHRLGIAGGDSRLFIVLDGVQYTQSYNLTGPIPERNRMALCDRFEAFLSSDETRLDLRTEPLAQSETDAVQEALSEAVGELRTARESLVETLTAQKKAESLQTVELGSLPVGAKFRFATNEIYDHKPDDLVHIIVKHVIRKGEYVGTVLDGELGKSGDQWGWFKDRPVILVSLPDPDPLSSAGHFGKDGEPSRTGRRRGGAGRPSGAL